MNEDEDRLDQPEMFELELELLRWVKKAIMETIPPIMQKPSGNAAQHYGLDSKSRWREAVCVMMILSEPAITVEGVSRLGRQMAQLFRQDYQLWDVKAKQLKNWVDRGLLNVKLLDRTLAYFQNQSSWLQYIKTLKKPIPKIESPGFPGTQWNEFYWKDQTVMLLMQEADFPDGKNPEFCAKLFKEETGKWRLKMEQFKRWLEKGKNDPLPEYYGTGKNCAECGVFLWDTRSYLKHMKRNHGYKIKEKDKIMIKNDKRDKPERCEEDSPNVDKFEDTMDTTQPKEDKTVSKSPDQKNHDSRSKDSFDSIFKGNTSKCNSLDNLLVSESEKNESDLDLDKGTSLPEIKDKNNVEKIEVSAPEIDKTEVARFEPDNAAPLRRRAAQKPAIKDTMVSCPECDFQCLHSKIVSHLKRCTKKAAQAKKKANNQTAKSSTNPKSEKKHDKSSISKENAHEKKEKNHESIFEFNSESDVKKHKESDIVKKVFLKKFEAQKNLDRKNNKYDDLSDDSFSPKDDLDEVPRMAEKQLPLKLERKKPKYDDVSDDSFSQKDETEKSPKLTFKQSPLKPETKKTKYDDISDDSLSHKDDLQNSLKLTVKQTPLKSERNRTKYDDISDDSFSHKDDIEKSPKLTVKELPLKQERRKTKYDISEDSVSHRDDLEKSPKLTVKELPLKPERNKTKYDDVSDDSFSLKDDLAKSPLLTEKQPPLKLKLSRKDFSSETSHFEVSVKKHEIDAVFGRSLAIQKSISDRSNQPTIMLKNINAVSKKTDVKKIYDPEKTSSLKVSDDWDSQSEKSSSKLKDDSDEEEVMPQKSRRSKAQPTKQEIRTHDTEKKSPSKVVDDWDDHSEKSSSKLKDDSSEEEVMPQKSRRSKAQPSMSKQRKMIYDTEKASSSKVLDDWNDHLDRSSSKTNDYSSEDEVLSQKSKRLKGQPKPETKVISNSEKITPSKTSKVFDDWDNNSEKSSSKCKEDSSEDEVMPQKTKRFNTQPKKRDTKMDEDQEKNKATIDQSDFKRSRVSQIKSSKIIDDWDNKSGNNSSQPKDDSSEEEILPQKSKRLKVPPTKKETKTVYEPEQIAPSIELPAEKIDDSSMHEILPQKSKRLKGFLESFKPVPETELKHLKEKREEESTEVTRDEIPASELRKNEETKESIEIIKNTKYSTKVDEKTNMKNKWLESLEKRNKGKTVMLEVAPEKPLKNYTETENISSLERAERCIDKTDNMEISNTNEQVSNQENAEDDKPITRCEDGIISPSDEPMEESVLEPRKKKSYKQSKSEPESFDVQEGRPSLRRGKMIPCPLCGVEYAIASNLQKHIDKEHSEGDDRTHNKRKSKEKADPVRKKKKFDDDADADADANTSDVYEDPSPGTSGVKKDKPSRRSDEIDNILEKSRTSNMEVDLDNPVTPANKEKENEEDKLTEYEIFQKLQLKEPSKTGKKKIECKECGLYLPTNTIKRHLLKHEKNALKAQALAESSISEKENKEKKVSCPDCDKTFPPNSIKKHMAKHRREKKNNESVKDNEDSEQNHQENEEFSDERIPCQQCGKMLPKNAMKRHLMKHETVSQESDSEKISEKKIEEENGSEDVDEEKPKSARKKVTCVECGLQCAPNVIKRHLEKHAKMKSMEKSITQSDIYAPIEITPTKEYWEYEKEKSSTKGIKSDLTKTINKGSEEKSSESDHSQEEEEEEREVIPPKKTKEDKKERSKSRKETNEMEPIHKTVKDLKEAEKAKNSEEESESENPLETAVRKVVSYRMTPKQALSIYNLTPKVLFDNLLGETDNDRMSILKKVNLSSSGEKKVINYCKQNEAQLSYKAVINCVRDLKIKDDFPDFSLSRLEAYRWWYAFRKKFDLKITAKKK